MRHRTLFSLISMGDSTALAPVPPVRIKPQLHNERDEPDPARRDISHKPIVFVA